MSTYVIKRLLLMLPTMIGITFLTYVIIRLAPGNPTAMQGDLEKGPQRNTLTSGDQGDYKKLLHLDKPAPIAYFYWVKDFFNPSLNVSSKYKVFVFEVIFQRLPNTLILNVFAILLAYMIGLPLGVDSAVKAGAIRERVITVALFLLYSLPGFWVGLVLVVAFGHGGYFLEWLPLGISIFKQLLLSIAIMFVVKYVVASRHRSSAGERGMQQPHAGARIFDAALGALGWSGAMIVLSGLIGLAAVWLGNGLSFSEMSNLVMSGQLPARLTIRNAGFPIAGLEPENARHMSYLTLLKASIPYYIMPVFCLTYASLAGESRYLRVGLMEIMRQDYIRTARAKGLKYWQVIIRHALPNALTPVIVQIAGIFPALIGGAVIVETIFGIPGMGLLFFEAVEARDYNLVMAETFMGAILVLFGTLLSDLLLPTLDPRVTFEAQEA